MIDLLFRAACIGGGMYAGQRLGQKYLEGANETPFWTGHLGNDVGRPAVSMTRVSYRGRVHYRLYIVAEGQWVQAGAAYEYPAVLAILQQWEEYLQNGGTIAAWQAQNVQRADEVARLEEGLAGT